jgi:endonuclease/exonuclease/phosphatase family metal-dependent hydrolase
MLNKIVFLFWVSTNYSWAISTVYFQNNSASNFEVNILQSGTHLLASNEWNTAVDSISAWQGQAELMWTNRNSGIHNGDDFYFDIQLKQGNDSFSLKLKLSGTFSSSNMWLAASGPTFNHPWYGGNNFQQANFSLNGRAFCLKYHAYFTGGYDDVFFALQDLDPYPISKIDTLNNGVLNVLAYNIYLLTPPFALTDQMDRANEIAKHVHGYDVLIFSEAFYNSARYTLQNALRPEYPYITAVVDNGILNDDGGVFIASRHPILASDQMVFDNCNGTDCLAAKGVMYVKIVKNGRPFHVFGMHTQAWNTAGDVATRLLQFQELEQFMQQQNIASNEALVIGGDLNVDKMLNNLGEYDGMLDSLQLVEPHYSGQVYTYDNSLSYYASPSKEFLDYALASNAYLMPDSSFNNVIVLRSIADNLFNTFDLSDHMAVYGRFVFPPLVSEVPSTVSVVGHFKVYPNPTKGAFSLDFGQPLQAQIRVFNALGQTILVKNTHGLSLLKLSLCGQAPGIYYVNTYIEGRSVFCSSLMMHSI